MDSKKCKLRIATYNIWNDDAGQDKRAPYILDEISNLRADCVGLQEVTQDFYRTFLAAWEEFPFTCFYNYSGEEEGLAVLCRYPIEESFFLQTSKEHGQSNALHTLITANGVRISLTNLHLPWDSARQQERQIVAVDRYIHSQQERADFFVLLGDFNGNLNSSVHRFLLGDQTIGEKEANPYWDDLQGAYCARTGSLQTATLDFIRNPRWKGRQGVCTPMVTDRIYVMESWETVRMNEFGIFGEKPRPETGMCTSDHYGVVAELEFEKDETN